MKILVINCGSSSLKYQLIDMENEEVLAKGLCERIGINDSVLNHTPIGRDKVVIKVDLPNHLQELGEEAFRDCEMLTSLLIALPDDCIVGKNAFKGCKE